MPSVKRIPLTKGYVTLVDDDVYEWAGKVRWHALESKGKVYAQRRDGLQKQSLHRTIMQAAAGAVVDHRDGDSLNNQRHNLRLASNAQNCQNRRPKRPGLKGVRWSESRQSWQATLVVDGTRYRRTGLATAQDAADAYDELALQHHGEFAILNRNTAAAEPIAPAKLRRFDVRKRDAITIYKRYAGPGAVYYTRFRVQGKKRTVSLSTDAERSFKMARKLKHKAREARFNQRLAGLIRGPAARHQESQL